MNNKSNYRRFAMDQLSKKIISDIYKEFRADCR